MSALDDRRAVALALGRLDQIGAGRMRAMLDLDDPMAGWEAIRAGAPPLPRIGRDLARAWQAAAAHLEPHRELERHVDAGVGVLTWGEPDYPRALASDRAAPGLLVWRGSLSSLDPPAVSVIGTRRCTQYGRGVAQELGRGLSALGISVVSGLALGIDGAAHVGALAAPGGAPPVAVVGGGLDHVYPRRHAQLWERVAEEGLLLSEAPLGVAPEAWRFPLRNRIIAALGRVLVVVESGVRGGSMHTVREADDRGRTVMAVPGSVRSPASLGTNQLLAEGCPPCRDVDDVLVALGLAPRDPAAHDGADADEPVELSADARVVVDALVAGPATLDQILLRTERPLGDMAAAVEEAVSAGAIGVTAGWYERTDGPRS
jgi:DNA processing protein